MPKDGVVLADTHCHLDLHREQGAVLRRAAEANVATVGLSNRPTQYRHLRERFSGRPNFELGLGLHPEAAGSPDEPHELAILRDYFSEARWIAEVGLDGFFSGVPTLDRQERMLDEILRLGVQDKLLVVHSRGAVELALDMLSAAGARSVIMHWYSGNLSQATRAIEYGYYFSINPQMLESQEDVQLVRWLPGERLLVETDGPFVSYRGRPVEPGDVPQIVELIAQARGTSFEELARRISANFQQFSGGPGP